MVHWAQPLCVFIHPPPRDNQAITGQWGTDCIYQSLPEQWDVYLWHLPRWGWREGIFWRGRGGQVIPGILASFSVSLYLLLREIASLGSAWAGPEWAGILALAFSIYFISLLTFQDQLLLSSSSFMIYNSCRLLQLIKKPRTPKRPKIFVFPKWSLFSYPNP